LPPPQEIFHNIWWLDGCEAGFLSELSVKVDLVAFAPREWIAAPEHLCIVMSGFVWRAGQMLTHNDSWGDIIVTAVHFRDRRRARALGCEGALCSNQPLARCEES
jgi:hypothetical protein